MHVIPLSSLIGLGLLSKTLVARVQFASNRRCSLPVPWSPIVGLLGANNDADQVEAILRLANITALNLTAEERHSHKTRIRAYRARAEAYFASLDDEAQKRATELVIREMFRNSPEIETRIREVLSTYDWTYQDGNLTAGGDTRELDDLLPLLRRRVLDRDLAGGIAVYSSEYPLSVLMIDLDKFKAINDTHGHQVGDQVLIACATVVAKRCRQKGKAYRYGGEEILALLPNFTLNEALAVAESIRSEVEGISVGINQVKVTLSIGVSVFPEHGQSLEELVTKADGAMYNAKKLGRNLVRFVDEQIEAPKIHAVPRRAPSPQNKLDADLIRTLYYTGRSPKCPYDGIPLRIREDAVLSRTTPDLHVSCPICGLDELIRGND